MEVQNAQMKPVCDAAFGLLQWAQQGEPYHDFGVGHAMLPTTTTSDDNTNIKPAKEA
jgi:hypothetical protein